MTAGLSPSQYGRAMENLAENAWTATSEGRLITYLPVLDAHAVDRAVTAANGGPPLFVQVKAHQRERPGDRLAFALALTDVGAYDRWHCLFLEGDPDRIREAYLVPGPALLARGDRGTLVDGRPCVRATLSPTSPTWSPYAVDPQRLGPRLETLLAAPPAPPALAGAAGRHPGRTEEEGAFFEESVLAALLEATPDLAPYRPAVDVGRDLLVQRAGTPRALYLQVKGTEREDRPGLARFQVRRRTFTPDPALHVLFAFARGGAIDPVWLVSAADLVAGASPGDAEHVSFEGHVTGPDPRWGAHRVRLPGLAPRLLALLA